MKKKQVSLLKLRKSIESLLKDWESQGFDAESINQGCCSFFANAIKKQYPEITVFWNSEMEDDPYGELIHCFIYYKGLYFDSEMIYGVSYWMDLPIFERISG